MESHHEESTKSTGAQELNDKREGEEAQEVIRPFILSQDVNAVDDSLTSLLEHVNKVKDQAVALLIRSAATSFSLSSPRDTNNQNSLVFCGFDEKIEEGKKEKNYLLLEGMQSSSSVPSSIHKTLEKSELESLSCSTQPQLQLSSYLLDKKVQVNSVHQTEEDDVGLAFRIDASNDTFLSSAELEKLKLHDDDNPKSEHLERNKAKEGDTISEFNLIERLQRITRHRDELKTLDNRLFKLSTQYIARLHTNSLYKMDINVLYESTRKLNELSTISSSLIRLQQQTYDSTLISDSSYSSNCNSVEIDLSNSNQFNSTSSHENKTMISTNFAIDLSRKRSNFNEVSPLKNQSIANLNTDNSQKRKLSLIETTSVNLKKSRLLAASSFLDNKTPDTSFSKQRETVSNLSLIRVASPLISSAVEQQCIRTAGQPTLIATQEPRCKKFRSRFYVENGNNLPNHIDTSVKKSDNKANSPFNRDVRNNFINDTSSFVKAEEYEDNIAIMNSLKQQQEQQYLFVKEYISQCQSLIPPTSPYTFNSLYDGSSVDKLDTAQSPANFSCNELFFNKFSSPTTSISSGDDDNKCCSQYQNQITYIPAPTINNYDTQKLKQIACEGTTSSDRQADKFADPIICQHSSLATITPKRKQTFYDTTYKQILTAINQEKRSVTTPTVGHMILPRHTNHCQLNQLQQHQHLRIAFRCQVCGSGFEDRHRLQQHLSIHLNLDPSWFEEKTIKETMAQYELKRGDYLCSTCNLRFETTAEYDKHMHLHGDKPHHCELCGQDKKLICFRFYRQLLTHLRSHCFLYSCRFAPDCKQTANRKDYLKLHILKHHLNNELPEQYTICCH